MHHECAADKSAEIVWYFEECFHHLVESRPKKIEDVWEQGDVTSSVSGVSLIKCLVTVGHRKKQQKTTKNTNKKYQSRNSSEVQPSETIRVTKD